MAGSVRGVPARPPGPRLREAMPRPLLILFAVVALAAVGIAAVLLARPPRFEEVTAVERRPPPAGTLSHDTGRVFPAPLPPELPSARPPCAALDGARPLGGPDAVARLTSVLARACEVTGRGVSPELDAALRRGLDGATIRFADFGRTGVESAVDLGARIVYLNIKFAIRSMPVAHAVPVLAHEAFHLAHGDDPVTAERELAARSVELAACRELISRADWPRWCTDADEIVGMGRRGAIEALTRLGYAG